MPMVVSNKQRIYYRFEGERGAFLLLHHGLLGCHQDWYAAGYVEELAKQFRLIIADARGHGRSDHPDQPADYDLDGLADDMIAILDDLDIRNTHFLGLSLGALVGFNLLQRYPERVRVTLLGGEVPFVSEAAREAWAGYAGTLAGGSLALLRARLLGAEAVPNPGKPDEVQLASARALLEAMCGWKPFAEERVSVRSPLALFCGEHDPALNRIQDAVARIARVRLIALPGNTTPDVFKAREPLLELLYRYIRTGRKGPEGRGEGADAEGRGRPEHGRGGGRSNGQRGAEEALTADHQRAPEAPAAPAAPWHETGEDDVSVGPAAAETATGAGPGAPEATVQPPAQPAGEPDRHGEESGAEAPPKSPDD